MNLENQINVALKEFSIGNKKNAYKKLKKIYKKNKNNDLLRFNLAVIEQSLNLNEDAKQNYKFLIEKKNNVKAMVNLYLLYIKEDDFTNALIFVNKVIDTQNTIDRVIKDKAFILYKLKQYDESIKICKKFIKKNNDIEFLNIIGLNYFAKKQIKSAEHVFKEALLIDQNNPIILNSLGRLYHEKRDSLNAEKYLTKAYNIKNDSYEIINNLAGFYREESNYKKAIRLYNKALEINPKNPSIINNIAKVYFDIDKLNLAKEYCLKALELNKKDGNIQKILSLIYFKEQNYKDGWLLFDGRLNLSDFIEKNTSINKIRKKIPNISSLNIDSKILVLREQGVGDEILYGTMYPDLLDTFKNVIIECDKRLINIFRRSFPEHSKKFVSMGSISENELYLEKFEYVIYAGSLGKFFRNNIKDFSNGNFLNADINLIKKYKDFFYKLEQNINIGISWKSFKNRYSDEKSLTLENIRNILNVKNCNFINLQYGDVENEIKEFNKKNNANIITIKDLDLFNDFDSLSAVLKNLNLFVSVSNSTAHLAGSLGVKTLLIKPANHALFHYWNQKGNETPWYKSITLISKEDVLYKKNLLDNYLSS